MSLENTPPNKERLSSHDFGPTFKWGVSSSALQTEGAHDYHGKGPSIWDSFVTSSLIKNNDNHFISGNFYHNFKEDIGIISELNIPNFRFSLSWSRIIPDGYGKVNQKGLDYYHEVIDHCLELGIEPWVTLYHWDLPLKLEEKGGWTNREIINWFEHYVRICINEFKGKVKHWMVLNEPLVFTGAGYFAGLHAPGRKGLSNFLPAVHHACLCMGVGFRVIKELQPKAIVGTTFSFSQVTPVSQIKRHVNAAIRVDALLNRLFIEASLGLGYPKTEIPALKKIDKWILDGDMEKMKTEFDFVGIQVYTREVVSFNLFTPYLRAKILPANSRKVYHTTMNWEVYPLSIYEIIKKVNAYDGVKKIIVTENGASFEDHVNNGRVNDQERIQYLKRHIEKLHIASREFHKLSGYFIWSLTDNFEWAEGFDQRFGLVHIDYETQKRTIKDSGYWYRNFLKGEST